MAGLSARQQRARGEHLWRSLVVSRVDASCTRFSFPCARVFACHQVAYSLLRFHHQDIVPARPSRMPIMSSSKHVTFIEDIYCHLHSWRIPVTLPPYRADSFSVALDVLRFNITVPSPCSPSRSNGPRTRLGRPRPCVGSSRQA